MASRNSLERSFSRARAFASFSNAAADSGVGTWGIYRRAIRACKHLPDLSVSEQTFLPLSVTLLPINALLLLLQM
jgi:hypothetical protein